MEVELMETARSFAWHVRSCNKHTCSYEMQFEELKKGCSRQPFSVDLASAVLNGPFWTCARSAKARNLMILWLRGLDLNQRPLGYEPNELPGCSTPHLNTNK